MSGGFGIGSPAHVAVLENHIALLEAKVNDTPLTTLGDALNAFPKYTFTVFRAKDGWCWRVNHRNGNEIARGSETYTRKGSCKRSLNRMIVALFEGKYWVEVEASK